jgi:nucleoid-associated protein YgaU
MSSSQEEVSKIDEGSRSIASESLVLDDDDEVIVLDEDLQKEITASESNEVIIEEDNIFHDEDDFKEVNRTIASASKALYEIEYGSYEVVKGDTLMLIAFKIYGDVSKWRNISILNEDQLTSDSIEIGMNLRFEVPEDKFVWKPMGTPYMVKEDDSLSIISGTVYDSTKHWKYIWDNNRPLVKNPNLIFAGFTLYFLPLDEKKKYQEVLNARYKRMEKALKVSIVKETSEEKLSKLISLQEVL